MKRAPDTANHAVCDGKPQSGALRGSPVRRCTDAVERFKDTLNGFGRQSGAAIFDFDPDRMLIREVANVDSTPRGHGVQGVLNKLAKGGAHGRFRNLRIVRRSFDMPFDVLTPAWR